LIALRCIAAVPPRTRKPSTMNTPTPVARHPLPKVTMETSLDDSGDYAILSPVINDSDAPTTTGTDDSGFAELEQWRQHMHHPPSLEGTCRALQFIWQLYCNILDRRHSNSTIYRQVYIPYNALL